VSIATKPRPADTVGRPLRVPASRRPSTLRYWLAAVIAVVGVGAGLTVGLTAYRDSQRQIDTFDGVSIPGTLSVQLDEPGGRVVYYEGVESVRFDDVTIAITDPAGTPVELARYRGEMIYDAPDSTQGRALATFDGAEPGAYTVVVSGVDTGRLVVGDSVARRALPGVLAGLAITGLAVVAAVVGWLRTFSERSAPTVR